MCMCRYVRSTHTRKQLGVYCAGCICFLCCLLFSDDDDEVVFVVVVVIAVAVVVVVAFLCSCVLLFLFAGYAKCVFVCVRAQKTHNPIHVIALTVPFAETQCSNWIASVNIVSPPWMKYNNKNRHSHFILLFFVWMLPFFVRVVVVVVRVLFGSLIAYIADDQCL